MKAKAREVEEKISLVYDSIDTDGSGKISAHEFDMIKNLDEVQEALSDLGILPNQFIALRDTLFNVEEEGEEESTKSRVVKPRQVKLNVDPESLDKQDDGITRSMKKRNSISRASLSRLQQAIEQRDAELKEVNTEEPTREIDFDEFIRICVSQRPENDMSVMDMNEIRKTARLGLRRLEKRSSLLLKAVQQLPRKEQLEQACINILKPLLGAAKAAKEEWSPENARANAAQARADELRARITELRGAAAG